MVAADVGPAHDFLLAQYEAFNAIENTSRGHRHFLGFISPRALQERLEKGCIALVAERRRTLLGLCEIHLDGYLTLLYVRGDHQGRGLGRLLLEQGLSRLRAAVPAIRTVRVRGTPYARGFYRHIGFEPLAATIQEDHGIRFHPFVLRLGRACGTRARQ